MAQQTAVEWLMQNIEKTLPNFIEAWRVEYEQAKQMEKEQIVKAYVEGINLVPCDVNSTDELDAKKYYDKTFSNK